MGIFYLRIGTRSVVKKIIQLNIIYIVIHYAIYPYIHIIYINTNKQWCTWL